MRKIDISKKELVNLYIHKKQSSYQIAKIYNCDASVIQKRLKEFSIKIRRPKQRINISKKLLSELYWKKGYSSYKISKILKIGRTTIYNKLISYGIKTKPKKVIKISKEKMMDLYYKKKQSLSQIGRKYKCSPSIILNKMKSVKLKRRNASESNTIYLKKKFKGDNCLKAYMIGFRLGDINVKKEGYLIKLKTNTTKDAQIKLMREVFGCYGHFYCKKISESYHICCQLDKSFNFLLPKQDKIENWILNNEKWFLAFFAGYIDAEGTIKIYDGRARFRVGSYDKNLLSQIYQKLNQMKINTKFRLETPAGIYSYGKHNGDFYRVSVNSKQDLLNLLILLKPLIRHEDRYNDLIKAENNIIERNKKYGVKIN